MQIRFRRVVRGKGKLVGSRDKLRSKNFKKIKKFFLKLRGILHGKG